MGHVFTKTSATSAPPRMPWGHGRPEPHKNLLRLNIEALCRRLQARLPPTRATGRYRKASTGTIVQQQRRQAVRSAIAVQAKYKLVQPAPGLDNQIRFAVTTTP